MWKYISNNLPGKKLASMLSEHAVVVTSSLYLIALEIN